MYVLLFQEFFLLKFYKEIYYCFYNLQKYVKKVW